MNNIKNIDEICQIVEELKQNGKKIVTANGSFDILHSAHANLLEKSKNEGDILIVLLNSDESISRNKGPNRPIIPELERAKMLASLKHVDFVVIFKDDKPLNYLEKIKPHVHTRGGSFDRIRLKEEIDFIENLGGTYKTFELESGFSTTNIIEKILNNGN